MDYFSYFNRITYDNVNVPDIFRRAKINDLIKMDAVYFTLYTIREGETPDIVAYNLYKNSNLYWIIMLTNNIINPQYDWPLSSQELDKMVDKKYGSLNSQALHHYETTKDDVLGIGVVVGEDYEGSKRAISNYTYELRLNDAKRGIKVLRSEYLNEVISQFKQKIK